MGIDRRGYDEKRAFIRMVLDCDVHYRDPHSGREGVARGRNLSSKGILMVADEAYPVGSRLDIHVAPSKAVVPPLDAEIEVVRTAPDAGGGHQLGAVIVGLRGG